MKRESSKLPPELQTPIPAAPPYFSLISPNPNTDPHLTPEEPKLSRLLTSVFISTQQEGPKLSFALSSSKGSGTYHWSPRFLATCLGQVYTPTPTHLQLILPSPYPPTPVLSASREWEKPLSQLGFLPQQLTLPMACCLLPPAYNSCS